jgi:hypothetical protein
MKLSKEEVIEAILLLGTHGIRGCELDNDGQLIIYTGIFVWEDGEYYDKPEEKE